MGRKAMRPPAVRFKREGVVLRSQAIQQQLVSFLPNLRAFAISLCSDVVLADDLVQETILKAWQHLDSFQEGTNLRAWLFTILRNAFLSHLRKRREEVPIDGDQGVPLSLSAPPEQTSWMDSRDFLAVVMRIPVGQREALLLVGCEGVTYDEAAEICGCPVGTIKSRVHRARTALLHLLDGDTAEDRAALADRHQALSAA